jgi:hypothetical protein
MVEEALKPETFASWWTPLQAAAYAVDCVGKDSAGDAIWQLLVAGMIQAVATSSSITPEDRSPITNNSPSEIPKSRWQRFSQTGSDLWNGGYARFWIPKGWNGRNASYRAFGIKLNPDDIRANLPAPNPELFFPKRKPALEPPITATANKGGAPRKDWWDDFWIEICRQIYDNELKPKTQADLEKAMFEWVENHRGGTVGETTIKAAARKLFKAWGLGSKT